MNILKTVTVTTVLLGVCMGALAGESCTNRYTEGQQVPTPSSTNLDYNCSGVLTPTRFKAKGGTVPLPDGASDSDMYAALLTADDVCGNLTSLWSYRVMNCCSTNNTANVPILYPGICATGYAELQKVVNVSQ